MKFKSGRYNIAKRPDVRKKISDSRKGKPTWIKGLTKESDKRVMVISKKLMGHIGSWRGKKNPEQSKRMKGKNHFLYGKHHTKDAKRKMSLSHIGIIPWNKELTKETDIRIMNYSKKIRGEHPWIVGELHPFWNGGSSYEPYGVEFNKKIKLIIKKRDKCCQMCSKKNRRYAIHHIDYDKMNNKEDNLILLCQSCHAKTNHNRSWWIDYFLEI